MMYIYKSAHIVSVEVAMFQKQHPCVTSIQLKKQNMTSTSEAPSYPPYLFSFFSWISGGSTSNWQIQHPPLEQSQ